MRMQRYEHSCRHSQPACSVRLSPLFFFLLGSVLYLAGCSRKPGPPPDGGALFAQNCATCHRADNDMRAPLPEALRQMSKAAVLTSLRSGRMKWEAKHLSEAKKNAIAEYLSAGEPSRAATNNGYCARDLDPPPNPPVWSGWGGDLRNRRFQPTVAAGITRRQVATLKLKWAFGFPGVAATYGQPTAFKGRLFVGSEDGTVYALDSATGCQWWNFKASATVKTAISIGNRGTTAFFGDTNGIVYAVKAEDGSLVWKVHADTHPAARITGSPLLVGTRLFVPVSSGEEGASADPDYPCCTFRGSVVALDTRSGQQIWKAYTIDEVAKPTRKNSQGVQYFGPSGAAVWSTPTVDLKRRLLYVTTGNNYSSPATASSDSVIAFDLETGKKVWWRQFTPQDLWNSGCVAEKKDNCPEEHGDDHDFGAPPILQSLTTGEDILLLAQKSGIVYALDPARQGQLLWKARIGHGGPLGGIEWGGAADRHRAYFPLSDFDFDHPLGGGGLFALDLRTGRQVWHVEPAKPGCVGRFGCSAAQMAPPTAIPGVIFSGSLDGHLRAYDTRDGSVLWDFDTAHEFHTTNGVRAHGGSLNGAGPAIVDGVLYVNTGYTNAMDGNALLAFAPDGH